MTGRVITEVVTGWTIVLLVTGIYLWWPRVRDEGGRRGLMRLKGKKYTVLRDLHSVSGCVPDAGRPDHRRDRAVLHPGPGKIIHDAAHAIMEDPETPPLVAGASRVRGRSARGTTPPAEPELPPGISLDEVVAIARREYPDGSCSRISAAGLPGIATRSASPRGTIFANRYGPYVLLTNLTLGRKDGVVRSGISPKGGHSGTGGPIRSSVGSFHGLTTKAIFRSLRA